MYTIFNGIECTCGVCGKLCRFTVLWANQHGTKIRLFCDACGAWTDKKRLADDTRIQLKIDIVKQSDKR